MQTNYPSEISELDRQQARSRFGLLLGTVYRQWRRQMDLSFKTLGLSDATRLPLLALYAHEGALRQKDLADALSLDTSSLVRVLTHLREAGLIDWEVDSTDRRAKSIGLTPAGRNTARLILAKSLEIESAILAGLSAQEVDVMRGSLEKIAQRFEALKSLT
ncbi:MAG: MarR family transcriptional regulator [Ottowia sp.]|uniref:MarR family winged helix-turn-helix transcriptional regulator n=1 Tax=Ottowia sp. TaxID=1898956 RepID=UPI003C74BC06